jgi:uncharacterized membrane protein
MRTPANIARHPIHPMLVAIPIGLWLFSLACDVIHLAGASSGNWLIVARYSIVGGLVGALVAAIPGFIDMLSLPGNVKRTALIHMAINLTVVVLYIVNATMRTQGTESATPYWLSLIGVVLLAVSGWLGGKMVYVHGVAVDAAPDQSVGLSPGRPRATRP